MRTRRQFIHRGVAGTAIMSLIADAGPSLASPSRVRRVPLGLQLYTVGAEALANPIETLRAVRKIGYESVELAGFLGLTPRNLRVALDHAGLICRSAHIQPRQLRTGPSLRDDPSVLAEQAHILGIDTIVMPLFNVPDRLSLVPRSNETIATMIARVGNEMTMDEWKANADFMNRKGRELKRHGLKFSYHNHNNEFAPVPGGGDHMRTFLERTDPSVVGFELDVGWVVAAGRNPLQLLRDYPRRFTAMHVKDIKASTKPNFELKQEPAEVGAGVINWNALLPAAYDAGIRRFFVEQEAPFARPPLESVRASFDYLSTLRV